MDISRASEFLTSGLGMGGTLTVYLIFAISLFVVARQEREEFAWFAFIPILSFLLMCKIGKVNPLCVLICLIPCFIPILAVYLWAKVGEQRGMSLWGWLMFIPCFWYISPIVIALGKK